MQRRDKMKTIAILGIACVDVIATPVQGLPKTGTLKTLDSITMHTGGCATNVAIDLARLGASSRVVLPLGNDAFGRFIDVSLDTYDIDKTYIMRSEKEKTSASMVLVNSEGERSFLHNKGFNARFSYEDIPLSFLKGIDILLVTGSFLMDRFDGEDTKRLLQEANRRKIMTVLDTAWDPKGKWEKTIAPCFSEIDLFVPSLEEARAITKKEKVEDVVDELKQMGAHDIIIKMGEEGAYADICDETHNHKAYLIDQPVDTTGAGDAFVAGIIYALANDMATTSMLKFANGVGSFAVQKEGASSGIPQAKDIFKRIEKEDDSDE